MAHRLLWKATTLCALLIGCSSSSGVGAVDAGRDARDAHAAVANEGGIPDATQWEANVPDALLSISDVGPDVAAVSDPANCVPPGTASNALGVGGYCTPGGEQCNRASPDGGPTLCTADFGAPAHLWFCTAACTESAQCGSASIMCRAAAAGAVCVPSACAAFAADGGLDGGDASPRDAASDSSDAAKDASSVGKDAGDAS